MNWIVLRVDRGRFGNEFGVLRREFIEDIDERIIYRFFYLFDIVDWDYLGIMWDESSGSLVRDLYEFDFDRWEDYYDIFNLEGNVKEGVIISDLGNDIEWIGINIDRFENINLDDDEEIKKFVDDWVDDYYNNSEGKSRIIE